MKMIHGKRIWKIPKPYNASSTIPDPDKIRIEFPDLMHFKGAWYCGFREAQIHENHPSGKARIIRSADGETWENAKLIEWDSADAGTPRFSITAEGHLMVNATLIFVSKEPRSDGYYYQLDRQTLGLGFVPYSDRETDVACQSATWLSADGKDWSSAYACPSAVNTNRFATTWYNGMGYSVTNALGKDRKGALHRTRDGKSWRCLLADFLPAEQADEADLAFGKDGTAYCLLRGNSATIAMLGIGKAPYYQEWEWKPLKVDWLGNGDARPIADVLRVQLGGPQIMCLNDGRLVAAGRTLGPARKDGGIDPDRVNPDDPEGREDGRVTLFWVNPREGVLTGFAEVDGTSYPGMVEHDGMIWVTYGGADRSGIFLAKVKLPD
jgi:hypothetical protein